MNGTVPKWILPDKVYGTDHWRTLDIDNNIKDFMILLVV